MPLLPPNRQDPNVAFIINELKKTEGFSSSAYRDGYLDAKRTQIRYSIGYGTLANSPNEKITEKEATRRLEQEVITRRAKVEDLNKKWNRNWTPQQINVLTAFHYNVGNISTLTNYGRRTDAEIVTAMPTFNKKYDKEKGTLVEDDGLTEVRKLQTELFAAAIPKPKKVPVVKLASAAPSTIDSSNIKESSATSKNVETPDVTTVVPKEKPTAQTPAQPKAQTPVQPEAQPEAQTSVQPEAQPKAQTPVQPEAQPGAQLDTSIEQTSLSEIPPEGPPDTPVLPTESVEQTPLSEPVVPTPQEQQNARVDALQAELPSKTPSTVTSIPEVKPNTIAVNSTSRWYNTKITGEDGVDYYVNPQRENNPGVTEDGFNITEQTTVVFDEQDKIYRLIPSYYNGKVQSPEIALALAKDSDEIIASSDNPEELDKYARARHVALDPMRAMDSKEQEQLLFPSTDAQAKVTVPTSLPSDDYPGWVKMLTGLQEARDTAILGYNKRAEGKTEQAINNELAVINDILTNFHQTQTYPGTTPPSTSARILEKRLPVLETSNVLKKAQIADLYGIDLNNLDEKQVISLLTTYRPALEQGKLSFADTIEGYVTLLADIIARTDDPAVQQQILVNVLSVIEAGAKHDRPLTELIGDNIGAFLSLGLRSESFAEGMDVSALGTDWLAGLIRSGKIQQKSNELNLIFRNLTPSEKVKYMLPIFQEFMKRTDNLEDSIMLLGSLIGVTDLEKEGLKDKLWAALWLLPGVGFGDDIFRIGKNLWRGGAGKEAKNLTLKEVAELGDEGVKLGKEAFTSGENSTAAQVTAKAVATTSFAISDKSIIERLNATAGSSIFKEFELNPGVTLKWMKANPEKVPLEDIVRIADTYNIDVGLNRLKKVVFDAPEVLKSTPGILPEEVTKARLLAQRAYKERVIARILNAAKENPRIAAALNLRTDKLILASLPTDASHPLNIIDRSVSVTAQKQALELTEQKIAQTVNKTPSQSLADSVNKMLENASPATLALVKQVNSILEPIKLTSITFAQNAAAKETMMALVGDSQKFVDRMIRTGLMYGDHVTKIGIPEGKIEEALATSARKGTFNEEEFSLKIEMTVDEMYAPGKSHAERTVEISFRPDLNDFNLEGSSFEVGRTC